MSGHLVHDRRETGFRMYPSNFLMGVIDTVDDAEAAIVDLLEDGVPMDEIHTWYETEGIQGMDPEGASHGLAGRIWRSAQRATPQHDTFERYADELSHGHVCVGVHCNSADDALSATEVLDRHGGHYVNYLGMAVIENMKP